MTLKNQQSGNIALIVLAVAIIVASIAAVIYFVFLAPSAPGLKLGSGLTPTQNINPSVVNASSLQKDLDSLPTDAGGETLNTTTDTSGL